MEAQYKTLNDRSFSDAIFKDKIPGFTAKDAIFDIEKNQNIFLPKTVKQQQLNNKTPDEQTSRTNTVQKTSGNWKRQSEIYFVIFLDKNIEDPCKSNQNRTRLIWIHLCLCGIMKYSDTIKSSERVDQFTL